MEKRVVKSRGQSQEDRGRNTTSVHGSIQAENSVEQDEQLLPGIPNEITLSLIAPKLPWKAFYILALVSRGWYRAIQSRQVYDARVRSKLTQTLVPLYCDRSSTIVLYSMEDSSCCHLPGIPGVENGFPKACEWIPLDGKLYVCGGYEDRYCKFRSAVYVFDLAGHREWKQCASMRHGRQRFGCDVKDGNIYVFGGTLHPSLVLESEVYEPEEGVWISITPLPSFQFRISHKVTTVGEELFLHHRESYDSDDDPLSANAYHPRKDEWSIVEHVIQHAEDKLLMVGGKLHRLNQDSIEVYDVDTNTWTCLQQNLSGVSEQLHCRIDAVHHAVAVDDKILAIVNLTMIGEEDEEDEEYMADHEEDEEEEEYMADRYLIMIEGVGCENTEIKWHILQCTLNLARCSLGMYPVRL